MIAAVLDEPQSSAPVKGRGGWYRNQYGEAVVSHPTRRNATLIYDGASSLLDFGREYRGDPIYGERGQHTHLLTECVERGEAWDVAEGERLGITAEHQAHIAASWLRVREAHGIRTTSIETPVVHDAWRVATNIDRTELDGRLHVAADTKTSSDPYQLRYAVQLAAGAGSVRYNQETGERTPWEPPLSANVGHIWWYPLNAALKCEPGEWPEWTLIRVDIRNATVVGNELAAMKYGPARPQDFAAVPAPTMAPVAPAPEVTEATGLTVQQPPPAAPVGDGPHTNSEPPIGSTGAGASPRARNGRPIPSPAEQRAALAGTPDEGRMADAKAFDALQAKYAALDGAASAWLTSVVGESMDAGVSFHAKDNRTVRRFELIRALVIVASSGAYVDPDAVRSLLYHVHGEVALWPALTLGHLVGSLGADDAAKFAQRCWEVVG